MKKFGFQILTAALVILALMFAGCSSKKNDEMPFKDGLYLEYAAHAADSGIETDSLIRIEFETSGDGYLVSIDDEEQFIEVWIDKYGITEDGYLLRMGLAGDIHVWIPPEKRKVGAKVELSEITREIQWKQWDVYVMKYFEGSVLGEFENYYDKQTGFLVGSKFDIKSQSGDIIITGTNADNLL